jgi:hypothetical protein
LFLEKCKEEEEGDASKLRRKFKFNSLNCRKYICWPSVQGRYPVNLQRNPPSLTSANYTVFKSISDGANFTVSD